MDQKEDIVGAVAVIFAAMAERSGVPPKGRSLSTPAHKEHPIMATMAMELTHADVQRLIEKMAWSHFRNHGGELEDVRQEAEAAYVEAYADYPGPQQARCSFLTWVGNRVKWKLKDKARQIAKRARLMPRTSNELLHETTAKRTFNLQQWLADLSEEARFIANLVFDPPIDVRAQANAKGGSPRSIKAAVIDYLEDLAWSVDKIADGFSEIQEALA